jgi:hypothetical protein
VKPKIYEVSLRPYACESRLLYGAETSGIGKGWEEIYKIQGGFCKTC